MTALLDLQTVAAALTVHKDTVRKGWKAWVRTKGFPAPVETRPYRWNPLSIDSYKIRREAENREAAMTPDRPRPANDRAAPSAGSREARDRDAVMALMQRRI